jgi:transcriptional regulator with XRE-family HTH domain
MAFGPSGRPDSAPQLSMMEEAGRKLKRIRERLGLKYRDIEEASSKIAAARQNDEFLVALSRLADIENKGTMPGVYRLYSLCAIYRLSLDEVLSWYGVLVDQLPSDANLIELPRTHMIGFSNRDQSEVQAPVALDPGIDSSKTEFLSRMIQRWGTLPLTLLKRVDLRNFLYGLIGTEDWFMYPIIPPGSLVVIDDSRRRIATSGWQTEFERPIYFLELRSGYACAWCSLREDRVILQPHPSSHCEPEVYAYPEEIEVIGQVTGVAMNLDSSKRPRPRA